jgi:hypothetical protein
MTASDAEQASKENGCHPRRCREPAADVAVAVGSRWHAYDYGELSHSASAKSPNPGQGYLAQRQTESRRGSLRFNHRIERLLDRGRQVICIDVLPLQFFPCHCLAPNVGCYQVESVAARARGQPGSRGSKSIIDPELAHGDSLPDVHARDLDGSTSKRSGQC